DIVLYSWEVVVVEQGPVWKSERIEFGWGFEVAPLSPFDCIQKPLFSLSSNNDVCGPGNIIKEEMRSAKYRLNMRQFFLDTARYSSPPAFIPGDHLERYEVRPPALTGDHRG